MPNKKAINRYIILERLLSSSVNYTYKKLLNDLNRNIELDYGSEMIIQERQLKYDLDEMKISYGLELNSDLLKSRPAILKRKHKHKLLKFDDQIPVEVLDNLKQVSLLLSQISGSEIVSEIINFTARVDKSISKDSGDAFITFSNNPDSKGLEFLIPTINAIKNKEVLEIEYDNKGIRKCVIVYPYHLKQSKKGAWHLYCLPKDGRMIFNLNLNFIIKINPLPNEKFKESSIDFKYYFEDVIDVAVPWRKSIKSQEVVIAIKKKYIRYVDRNPLHSTQLDKKSYVETRFNINQDEYSIRYYDLKITTELVRYLLQFADDIIVLSPKKLVNKIRDNLKKSYENYL